MVVSHRFEVLKAKFSDLQFDPVRHMYFVNGEQYPSVSSKVEGHAEKFNAEQILPYSAKKEGVEVDVLRQRWKDINKIACDLGTNTHDSLERYTGLQTPTTPQQKAGVQFIIDMSAEYEILFRELRMYSREFRYAGTEDLILIHRTTGAIIEADYKTNADLFKNYKNKTLLEPFDYLESTPYNKYQLQLSYYQIPLEEVGCKVDGRMLVYLKPDGTYRIFETLDFTKELREYMVYQKGQEKKKPVVLW